VNLTRDDLSKAIKNFPSERLIGMKSEQAKINLGYSPKQINRHHWTDALHDNQLKCHKGTKVIQRR
jgi:hypothetical protein